MDEDETNDYQRNRLELIKNFNELNLNEDKIDITNHQLSFGSFEKSDHALTEEAGIKVPSPTVHSLIHETDSISEQLSFNENKVSFSAPNTPQMEGLKRLSGVTSGYSIWDSVHNSAFSEFIQKDKYPLKQREVLLKIGKRTSVISSPILAVKNKHGKDNITSKTNRIKKFNLSFTNTSSVSILKKKRSMTDDGLIQIFKLAILDHNTLLAINIYTDFSMEAIRNNYSNLRYYFLKAMANHLEQICVFMLENGFPLDVNEAVCRRADYIMPTFLLLAISFGLEKLLKTMIKMGPDCQKTWYGVSPVMLATLKGHDGMVRKIVEMGGNILNGISIKTYILLRTLKYDFADGKTQNHLFCITPIRQLQFPDSPKVEFDRSAFLKKIILPLEFAIVKFQENTIQTLLSLHVQKKTLVHSQFCFLFTSDLSTLCAINAAGAICIDHVDSHGSNSLHHACRSGDLDKVIFLIRIGIDINSSGEQGWTPLQEAITQRQYDIIQYLVLNNANILKKNNNGQDSREIARKTGFSKDQIEFYLDAPVSPIKFKYNEQEIDKYLNPKTARSFARCSSEIEAFRSVPSSPKLRKEMRKTTLASLASILRR